MVSLVLMHSSLIAELSAKFPSLLIGVEAARLEIWEQGEREECPPFVSNQYMLVSRQGMTVDVSQVPPARQKKDHLYAYTVFVSIPHKVYISFEAPSSFTLDPSSIRRRYSIRSCLCPRLTFDLTVFSLTFKV